MPNPGAPSLQDIFSGNATAPTQTAPASPSLGGKPSLGQIFTPGVFNPIQSGNTPQTPTSPFNPNSQNSQFVQPGSPQPGTSTASKFAGSLAAGARGTLGNLIVKPFAQTGVSGYNAVQAAKDLVKNGGKPSAQATQDLNQSRNLPLGMGKTAPLSTQHPFAAGAEAGFQGAGTVDLAGEVPELASGIPELASKVDVRMGGQATENAAKSLTNDATNEALDVTKPVMDKKSSISALENAGKPGGVNSTLQTTPDQHATDVANSVKGLVKKGATAAENNTAINSEISRISEQEIKPFLDKNPAPFNQATLSKYIDNKTSIPNYIKADPVLQKTYDLTKQSMMDEVAKQPKTTSGLWAARKSFDKIAENEVGKLDPMSEKVSASKQAALDVRRSVNNFIAEKTPNGDTEFTAKLKDLSNKYEARSNIAENNYKLVNKNAVTRFKAQHPTATKIIKGAGTVAGFGIGDKILKATTGEGF